MRIGAIVESKLKIIASAKCCCIRKELLIKADFGKDNNKTLQELPLFSNLGNHSQIKSCIDWSIKMG